METQCIAPLIRFLFPLEQGNDEEQHTGTEDGHDEFPKETGLLDADQTHEPAADEAANDTDDDVDDQAGAAAFHQFTSQPASHCAKEQIKDNTYNVHFSLILVKQFMLGQKYKKKLRFRLKLRLFAFISHFS